MSQAKEEIWVTKDGTPIKVADMHEEHCRNTLRMLIKQIRDGELSCLGYHHERLNEAYEIDLVDKLEATGWLDDIGKMLKESD